MELLLVTPKNQKVVPFLERLLRELDSVEEVYIIPSGATEAQDPGPKQELLAQVQEAVEEMKLYRRGELQLPTFQEFLDELPD